MNSNNLPTAGNTSGVGARIPASSPNGRLDGKWKKPDGGECLICHHPGDWCGVSPDGAVANCHRQSIGAFKTETTSDGTPCYYHWLIEPPAESHAVAAEVPAEAPKRADVGTLHAVYSAMLGELTLSAKHLDDLVKRGLTPDEVSHRGYKTLEPKAHVRLAAELHARFGTSTLLSIPGFFVNPKGLLSTCILPGLLVPVRDAERRIVALKVRPDERLDSGNKYLWASSSKRGGPGPGAPPHVPIGIGVTIKRWRLTEGELKADIATVLSGVPTISAPGATNWKPCLPVLDALGCRTVLLAFDADAWEKATVGKALGECFKALVAGGFAVELERWDPAAGKGIDDVLAAGGAVEVLTGDDAARVIATAVPAGDAGGAAGNGRDSGGGTRILDGGPIRPNEAEDDPHRLARIYRDRRCIHPDGLKLRYHQGEWRYWDKAYDNLPDKDIRARLTGMAKEEFDRLNEAERERWLARGKVNAEGKECPPPVTRKVTTGLVNNVVQALAGFTLLESKTTQPAWLIGDPPFPAHEVLPMRNALVHLPSLVDGLDAVRPPTPAFFGHYALDYDFDCRAPEPVNWLTFLGKRKVTPEGRVQLQLWPDDHESIDTLQEWFGYTLLPDTSHQKILGLFGPKRSGKGTIARIQKAMLGPANVVNPTLSSLGTNFGLAPLIGKPAATITDARLSGRTDIAQTVERLLSISGEDAQTIDRKHMASWTGTLSTRFMLISNELPRLPDTSGALAGRMIVLPLTRTFFGQEDRTLTGLLLPELPGILLWAIEGWRRLRERGYFVQPASGKPLVEEMEDLSSPVGAFLKERCIVEPGREIIVAELFAAWKAWCEEKGRDHTGDEQRFGRDLRAAMPQLATPYRRLPDGTRKRFYEGIDLVLGF